MQEVRDKMPSFQSLAIAIVVTIVALWLYDTQLKPRLA